MQALSGLQIALLGPLQVQVDGNELTHFSFKKGQALLAYLAVEGDHPHRRETLAGLLWPEQPELAARQSLRQVLLKLRQVIPDQFLLTTPQTVQLNPASNYQLDVRTFTAQISACRHHAHADLSLCEPCLAGLQLAVASYRGDFLAGFFLEDSDVFEEWALLKREWLRREVGQMLFQLGAIYTGRGEYAAAYAYAWRQIELEPLHEEAHQQLMRVLALSGRRSEALAQYEACCTLLAKELGVPPAAETTLLYEQIRAAKFGQTEEKGPQAKPSAPPHNLPAQLTPFVGRKVELAALADLLAKSDVRLLILLGPGGMGKTRLALEIAANQVDHFRDGVYFVALAAADTSYAVIPLIADALKLIFYEGSTPHQQLCDYLRHRNTLLVLDNFEHLLGDAARLDEDELTGISLLLDLLQVAPGLKILVTSRTRLNIQGEQLYFIDGIDLPSSDKVTLGAATQSSAVQLFVQSARRVQAAFTLTDDNVGAVTQICHLVQGMPLAILLAAAWVQVYTPAEILAELSQHDELRLNLDLLETDLRNVPARQRSLRALFDHSWRLLPQPEQELFRQLSIFRGGFTRQAAQAVTAASPQALMTLVNQSLLQWQVTRRYDLHELLRQYATEHLAQTPALDEAVRNRHSAFYCALLSGQEAELKGSGQQAAMTIIEDELENLSAAWDWAVVHGQIEQLAQAMHSLGWFYVWRSRYQEGEAVYGNTARQLQAMNDPSPAIQRLLVRLLAWQSNFTRRLGRLAQTSQVLQQCLDLLDNPALSGLDLRHERADVLFHLGNLYEEQAEFVAGTRCYQQAHALYEALADLWGAANSLAGLGEFAYRSGDYEGASRLYHESLALLRRLGDQKRSASVLGRLAHVLRDQGQLEAAEQLTKESVALYALLGDRAQIAAGQYDLGWSAIFAGSFAEAYGFVEKCIAIREDLGLPTHITLLGLINLELGNYQTAHSQLQMQLQRSRATGDKDEIALGLDVLSCLAVVEARYEEAQHLIAEAIALHREIGEEHRLAHAQAFWGYAARGLGRRAEAQHYFFQALHSACAQQGFLTLLFVLPGIALLLADQGEVEGAIELYAQIADVPMVANSQMRWDLAGRHLDAIATPLPREIVAAARARGKAGDLWFIASTLLVELTNRGWATDFYQGDHRAPS